MTSEPITITKIINAPIARVYQAHIGPIDLIRWQSAGEGWFASHAEANPIVGGSFSVGYASPDGSQDFDFGGTYSEIIPNKRIAYHMNGDNRAVVIEFEAINDKQTELTTIFDPESLHSTELQRAGWSSVLDNMIDYIERISRPGHHTIRESIEITATPQSVWEALWNHDTYRKWAAVFAAGFDYTGDLVRGEQVRFTAPSGHGMISQVAVCSPARCMAFRNIGIVQDGVDDFNSVQMLPWKGFREEYLLTPTTNGTRLDVYCDTATQQYDTMQQVWGKALLLIKQLSETR